MSVGAATSRPDVSAQRLAEQITAGHPRPRDAATARRAKAAVISAFGRAHSGAQTPVTKALLDAPAVALAGGPSLVFGTERRTSAVDAALINATAAAAGSEASIDAANAAFIVTLFGLCEAKQKTGQALIDALMFGAEMSAALAPANSQLGSAVLGAAAAATHVLDLSLARTTAALHMAALGNPDDTRPLIIGLSLKNVLLAALLAEAMDEATCTEMAGSEGRLIVCHAGTMGAPTGAAFDLLAVRSPPGADLWDQFEQQASAVLPRDHVAPLFERLETLDKVTDLATVSRLLQGRSNEAVPKKIVFAARGTHEPEETTWVP